MPPCRPALPGTANPACPGPSKPNSAVSLCTPSYYDLTILREESQAAALEEFRKDALSGFSKLPKSLSSKYFYDSAGSGASQNCSLDSFQVDSSFLVNGECSSLLLFLSFLYTMANY
jgi:hypothetical protein